MNIRFFKLDPTNHKTVLDIQQERAEAEQSGVVQSDEEDEEENVGMQSDLVPIPASGGIDSLREKLHAKIASFSRKGFRRTLGEEYGGDTKDALLEAQRRRRAELRERRRKETREKIQNQKQQASKKDKEKDKSRSEGPKSSMGVTKVNVDVYINENVADIVYHSCWYRLLPPLNLAQILRRLKRDWT